MLNTNELRVQRLRVHKSQEQVANDIGCHKNTYSKIENGKAEMTLDMVDPICKSLDIHTPEQKLLIFLGITSQ